ncbi:DUF4062 domain-containing protein [Luteimonas sp. M1R5S18]|uniref:DUF4062 domain-containing protein n=1 Tax=Luteimonas rhizosphaericola TaxID=3042024 RepID=A0ABT6JLZ2_9GAMM|nr:DUF4062 domain-containing protein [Luteimonas rhizosphaericola]MDH5831525.1 DUF4062 domain-containing protein [Luteimonas rhizosphaericola]
MVGAKRLIRIFLASPGDLAEERKLARSVVEEVNSLVGDVYECRVELVGWEDTVSVFGRPQATINRDLERCDFFIGMIWKRWGTPPDTEGHYSSGFEEEFRRSVERRTSTGSPEISLFFKEVSPEILADPGPELRKVLDFKSELIGGKSVLFEQFSSTSDFERRIRRCVFKYLESTRQELADPGKSDQSSSDITSSDDSRPLLLSAEGTSFLRDLVGRTEDHSIDSVDIARFRLLSSISGLHGNDESLLGTHDANLMFLHRDRLSLGTDEIIGLISCGLANIASENVPLWHWISPNISKLWRLTLTGPSPQKAGALRAMLLVGEKLPDTPNLERSLILREWLSEEREILERVAALEYLVEHGETQDLPIIRLEIESNHSQTSRVALDSYIRTSLKSSRNDALDAICELQPSAVSDQILNDIFSVGHDLNTATLQLALQAKHSNTRLLAAQELIKRDEFPTELAEAYLNDDDRKVRLVVIDLLSSRGQIFSEARARALLVEKKTGLLLGQEDDSLWRKHRRQTLIASESNALAALREQESIFEIDILLAQAAKARARGKATLRGLIENQFYDHFDRKLESMERSGFPADTLTQTRALRDFLTDRFTRAALNLLGEIGDASDLPTVRLILSRGKLPYSASDTELLRKHGEWKDIELLISSESRRQSPFLTIDIHQEDRLHLAETLVALGKHRLRELLEMPMPGYLLADVIVCSPEVAFSELSSKTILTLFDHESETVRRFGAIKFAKSNSKRVVRKMLNAYTAGQTYFYNVSHWLDFSCSLPAPQGKKALGRLLKERRQSN